MNTSQMTLTDRIARYEAKITDEMAAMRTKIETPGVHPLTLVTYVNALVELQGELEAYELAAQGNRYAEDEGKPVGRLVTSILTSRLLRGADDRWSGRGNDGSRALFDGFRTAAERIIQSLDD